MSLPARWALAALLLLPAGVRAAPIQLRAWSADGVFLTYEEVGRTADDTHRHILNTATGARFELSGEEVDEGESPWETWLKVHPMVLATPSPLAPDGRTRAEVKGGEKGRAVVTIRRGGAVLQELTSASEGSVQLSWSPTGRRLALLHAGAPAASAVEVFAVGEPQVELLALASRQAELPAIAATLAKAGVAVARTGVSTRVLKRNAAYSAAGYEKAAQKIADLVPGNTALERLDLQTSADVVVILAATSK